jgi:ABC-type molybdate transport system substrate-binding protein
VHVRRALLLFAIVLGLAAIAASLSRTSEDSGERAEQPAAGSAADTATTPSVSPGNASEGLVELDFDASGDQVRRVEEGQPATLLVEVDEPGLAEIPELGLSANGDVLTPARFEVRVSDPGRYDLSFTPAADDTPSPAGTLVVRSTDEE